MANYSEDWLRANDPVGDLNYGNMFDHSSYNLDDGDPIRFDDHKGWETVDHSDNPNFHTIAAAFGDTDFSGDEKAWGEGDYERGLASSSWDPQEQAKDGVQFEGTGMNPASDTANDRENGWADRDTSRFFDDMDKEFGDEVQSEQKALFEQEEEDLFLVGAG